MAQARTHEMSPRALTRRVIFASTAMIAIPLLVYPHRLGFPSFDLNPATGLLEWTFYVGVFSLFETRLPLSSRVVAGGFSVMFRLVLGLIAGTAVAWLRGNSWSGVVAVMMWSYPLALVPQVLFVPFTLRPVWERALVADGPAGRRRVVTSRYRTPAPVVAPRPSASAARVVASSGAGLPGKPPEPSFDDAVAYVGEYDGVRMCWIVDGDGLPLAVWQRQHYTGDFDFWVPVAVEMVDFHQRRLSAAGPCRPERVEVSTDQGRIIVEAVQDIWLGVLTDPDADELIGVRLSRARDMIARQLQQSGRRYAVAAEVQYV